MENFPTNQRSLLPHAANLLTLVVLVSTGWWSSGQRPVAPSLAVAAASAPAAAKHGVGKMAAERLEVLQAPVGKSMALLPADGIVSISYTGAGLR